MPNLKFQIIELILMYLFKIWILKTFYRVFFRHGKNKFFVGAAIAGAGLLTGNQGITSLGTNLAGLGLKTKLAAHLFPSHGK